MFRLSIFGAKEVVSTFEKHKRLFGTVVQSGLQQGMFYVEEDAKVNAKGRVLGRGRTGNLSSHIFTKVEKKQDGQSAMYIGYVAVDLNKVPYARVHEFGTAEPIRPKKGKYLTIPFPGVKGFVKDYSGTFVMRSRRGNLIIAQNLGKTKTGRQKRTRKVMSTQTKQGYTFRPLFLLRTEVRIPARPYLRPALLGNVENIKNSVNKAIEDLYKQLGVGK